jgi:hypothetical protein
MSKVQQLEAAVAELPREDFQQDAQNGRLKMLFEKLQNGTI